MQKMLSWLAAFFAVLLLREKQKKPFVSPTFLRVLCLQDEEKTSKKIHSYKHFPINNIEAHIPKIRQI